MNAIIDQILDYCDCLPEKELKNEAKVEKNVEELIHLISLLTCWTQEACETFLNSSRKEYMDVEEFDPCYCDGGVVEFFPFYSLVDPESIQVSLIEIKGITETETLIDEEYFSWSEISNCVRIDLRKFARWSRCGCPNKFKLKFEYNAGHDLIPECLLPIFCDLLHVIFNKNRCDCSACQSCGKGDDVEIEWDDDVAKNLDTYLRNVVESGYQKQLGLISLCHKFDSSWGAVL